MNHLQEPEDIDLFVGPSVLTEEDKRVISEAIAAYKAKAATQQLTLPANPLAVEASQPA